MSDIYFYEAFEEEQDALKKCCPATLQAGYTRKTIQEAGHATPPARIISVRTQSAIPENWAPHIDAILSRSAGYDHLTRYQQTTGAPLHYGYLPLYCVEAVAEQAMLLWMALLRKLPIQTRQFNTFERDGITGREAQGRTILVVGVGKIGYGIIQLARALRMRVLGTDLVQRHDDVEYVSIEEGLPQADIIVAAMNLNNSNYDYFNYDRLSTAKPDALFINIARGELASPVGLLQLLQENRIGGVGMDVYSCENELAVMLREKKNTSGTPEVQALLTLSNMDNVICTPHNAFNTIEAVQRKATQSIEQILHLQNSGTFLWEPPRSVFQISGDDTN